MSTPEYPHPCPGCGGKMEWRETEFASRWDAFSRRDHFVCVECYSEVRVARSHPTIKVKVEISPEFRALLEMDKVD